jgi:hypothetical protein
VLSAGKNGGCCLARNCNPGNRFAHPSNIVSRPGGVKQAGRSIAAAGQLRRHIARDD